MSQIIFSDDVGHLTIGCHDQEPHRLPKGIRWLVLADGLTACVADRKIIIIHEQKGPVQ